LFCLFNVIILRNIDQYKPDHNLVPLNFLLVWAAINPELSTLPNLILTTVLMSSNN